MSTASSRSRLRLGRALRGLGWTVVFAGLAAGAAGLVGESWHAAGGAARPELTWAGDHALGARLDAATTDLVAISTEVEELAAEAKTALEEVASVDATALRASLTRGAATAAAIDAATRDLRNSLVGLPGDDASAPMLYSNDTLVRRAAILAALEAAASLQARWSAVTARATDAAQLTTLISTHDTTVLDAAAKGVDAKYLLAADALQEAMGTLDAIQVLRAKLISDPNPTVLDEWVDRWRTYDTALRKLYLALKAAKGDPLAVEVQSARREERLAFGQLPPDRRTIIVIVAEVARGGLTQAVIAIEEAHGHIDEALDEAPDVPEPTGPATAAAAP